MANKVISIEIGLQTTKICEVTYKKNTPHIYNCITIQTPEDTVEDGYIRDKYKFVAAVKEKIKEADIKCNKVIFTVASNKIANREVILPLIKDNQIQDVINTNASEYFPVDISDYILTYSILEKINTKDEKKLRILVLAAPGNLIKNYYNVAELLGYEVAAIDYVGNSAFQIVTRQVNTGTNLMIQINEQSTFISIIEEGILKLQRTVTFGTMNVVHSVISEAYFAKKDENEILKILTGKELINPEYNKLKEEAAAAVTYINETERPDTETDKIKNEVTETLQYLVNNVVRVIDYYFTKYKKSMDAIYVTGQGSKLKGLDRMFQNETGLAVKKLDVLNSITCQKNLSLDGIDLDEYISCIGAAVAPVQFIPKEYKVRERSYSLRHGMKFILLITSLVCLAYIANAFLTYQIASKDNNRLKNEIKNLSNIDELYHTYIKVSDTYNEITRMNELSNIPTQELNGMITELEKKLPARSQVENLTISPTDITLSMRTDSLRTAAMVLQQLKQVSYFNEIATNGMTKTESTKGKAVVRFVVTGKLNTEGNGGE